MQLAATFIYKVLGSSILRLEMFEEAFIIKAVAFAPPALPLKYNNQNCSLKEGNHPEGSQWGVSSCGRRTAGQLLAALREAQCWEALSVHPGHPPNATVLRT